MIPVIMFRDTTFWDPSLHLRGRYKSVALLADRENIKWSSLNKDGNIGMGFFEVNHSTV
jgi:hypothetical protein